jgi:hypothetical protein
LPGSKGFVMLVVVQVVVLQASARCNQLFHITCPSKQLVG